MVRAVNACGNGLWSDPKEESIRQPPRAARGLAADDVPVEASQCGITLAWQQINDGGAEVLEIEVAANAEEPVNGLTGAKTACTYRANESPADVNDGTWSGCTNLPRTLADQCDETTTIADKRCFIPCAAL